MQRDAAEQKALGALVDGTAAEFGPIQAHEAPDGLLSGDREA